MTPVPQTELAGDARPVAAGFAGGALQTVAERVVAARVVLALWLGATLALAAVSLAMHLAGVPGWDEAAHLYKASVLAEGQSVFWDNLWYGGSYGSVTYGFIYYWLVQYVPASLVVVLAGGAIPACYYVYQTRLWGIDDRWPAVALAFTMAIYLAHGQDPFVLALALSLAGLALLGGNRAGWAALAAGIGVFVNPMGIVVAGVLMLADVLARPALRRRYLRFFLALAPAVVARLLVGGSFAEPGEYLNETTQMLVYLGFALAGVALAGVNAVHRRAPFVILFLIYAGLVVASFVTPGTAVGNNVGRFFMVFGLPLMILLRHSRLQRPFPYGELAIIPILLFALIQLGTPLEHLFGRGDLPQTRASFFTPALTVAAERCDANHRIHVVALRRHWEAYYFPRAGYAITRGWYRQADAIHNGIFYTNYNAAAYATWLRRMGVEYVFLADAPLDLWSQREARLLRTSPEFEAVEQAGAWTIYRVARAQGLAVGLDGGQARVTSLRHRAFSVTVDRPGAYLIKVTWSPYWRLWGSGSLSAGPERFVRLEAPRAGVYTATFEVTAASALAALAGGSASGG